MLAAPLKFGVGANDRPSSAVLMLAIVPVKVIVASAVPSPEENVSPLVPGSVITPLVPVSVTCAELDPASTSLIEIRLPLPDEKTRAVSSFVLCAAGTLLTGASLTALTVMATESVSLSAPPEPVLPWSLGTSCKLAAPLKSAGGAKRRAVRAALIRGVAPRNGTAGAGVPSPVGKVRPVG